MSRKEKIDKVLEIYHDLLVEVNADVFESMIKGIVVVFYDEYEEEQKAFVVPSLEALVERLTREWCYNYMISVNADDFESLTEKQQAYLEKSVNEFRERYRKLAEATA